MTAQARLLGGRYQVGELLGYGGMAEVHKGRDLRLGRDVAIKMLRTDLARDATFQERFRREAQNSAALNHPAIVAVYDTGEEISDAGEKHPFIVMEFVNGRTLKEVLAQEQRLQPRRALEIIADICAALEFSHRHGIIHRDIKPGNVMITQNGQVKVMDFGIARALASGATTMTQTSAVIGTAQYLSPEQARGESVDARSDVYAAGCVLFELVIGHPPFVGDSPVSVAYQHVREEPRVPSSVNRDVPPDIDAIVLKALAKNPLNRYQSAQEMRADALRAVSGRPVMATPVMSQAETMAMTGGAGQWQPQGATTVQRPVQPAMAGPDKPESRSSWVMAVVAGLAVLVVVVLGVALAMSKGNEKDKPTGPTTVAMPRLEGLTPEDAEAELNRLGLTNTKVSAETKKDCTGTVSLQNPKPGANVTAADVITYKVCNPLAAVTVPSDLKGVSASTAERRLAGLGLVPKIQRVNSTDEKDRVLDVEKAGESVDQGTTITVKVSNNALVKVPDVENKSFDAAQALLEINDLIAEPIEVQADGVPGTVIKQLTEADREVKRNSKVQLQVIAATGAPDPSASASGGAGTGENDN
ncbi:Stk1 family PASTA domain-containing Ser/Thr kinase [Actinoplanes sp. NEAU-A12]|uniref:non-specific serine/threonine protein kinase n=1 Tax=Actinoplanes sandaracinus TaxID=3045177 RepID=A0ABT6WT53_9ACTN|nr:Stk1 family PASTA domain-containing Ser/Thr kinase [Actinoplanes sandaracinus]MDI6099027.1 Stk1 family PASTA domain-containing Ser/Thr kinase [Actinoplanes sandaracinus]MDI6102922.1 Stk1 family PASTA domain-containing Ser/Thr kinase [Actinoplanes sandaracinus]